MAQFLLGEMMLSAHKVEFDYAEHPLLSRVNFTVSPGECLHIQGQNGVGKTTLLKLIVGLIKPQAGEIHWQGKSIDEDLSAYIKLLVYVGHQAGLSHALSIEENAYLDWHWGRSSIELNQVLEVLQLQHLSKFPVAMLSQGQQRKAALLRLWMTDALIWVLDEPFIALDEPAKAALSKHMNQHLEKGGMLIMTSHQRASLLSSVRILELK